MTYGKYMNDMTDICAQVWTVADIESKRNLLRRAVETFKYKAKRDEFLDKIAKADANTCDKIASNLILNKTDKVVSLLPR